MVVRFAVNIRFYTDETAQCRVRIGSLEDLHTIDSKLMLGLRADSVLVRASFTRAAPDSPAFAAAFYLRFFELAPMLRALFPSQMRAQEAKFAHALHTLLDFLEAPEVLVAGLRQLGARHRRYGAQPMHFALVGEALIQTLERALANGLSAAERGAWQRLFGWIMAQMVVGWSEAEAQDAAHCAA